MRLPIASSPGHWCAASHSLTITTGGVPRRSVPATSRPRRIGISIVSK
jgi:hypothetical protein